MKRRDRSSNARSPLTRRHSEPSMPRQRRASTIWLCCCATRAISRRHGRCLSGRLPASKRHSAPSIQRRRQVSAILASYSRRRRPCSSALASRAGTCDRREGPRCRSPGYGERSQQSRPSAQASGRPCRARRLYERALAIEEKALGGEHPARQLLSTSSPRFFHDQGELSLARPYYERALAINEKTSGPDHLATVVGLNSLAGLLQDQGDFEGAQPLLERALAAAERTLGPAHPNANRLRSNLAKCWS